MQFKLILERLFGRLGSAADSLGGLTQWDQVRAGILQHHTADIMESVDSRLSGLCC